MGNFSFTNYNIGKKEEKREEKIVILFFKSEHCVFCPAALERVKNAVKQFDEKAVEIKIIDVDKNPEKAQEYGVLALPTTIIGNKSVTGVPDNEIILSMILTARLNYGDDI